MIRRSWIVGFACLLIIGAGFWSRFKGETSVREDPAVPPTAEEAEAELRGNLESLLHDMAIAQEQFRTGHPRYTDDIRDLIAGGVDIPPDVDVPDVSIELAIRSDYCMEARAQDLTYFYWALKRGGPEEGSCAESVGSAADNEREVRANLQHVLRDAYNAMYSFWNSHQRFTRKVDQLVKRGFQPVRGIDLRVAFVDEDQFCLEASGGGLTYFSWDDYGSEGECGDSAP